MEKQVENFNKVAESLEHLLNLPELVHSVNTSLGLQCILQQHVNNQTYTKVLYITLLLLCIILFTYFMLKL